MKPRSRLRADLPAAFHRSDPVPTLANSSPDRVAAFTDWLLANLPGVDLIGLCIPAPGATIGDVLDAPHSFPTLTPRKDLTR